MSLRLIRLSTYLYKNKQYRIKTKSFQSRDLEDAIKYWQQRQTVVELS